MLTLSFSTFFFQFWLFNSIIDLRSAIEVLISFSSDFSVSGSVIFSGRRLWNMILKGSILGFILVAVDGYKNDKIVHLSHVTPLRYASAVTVWTVFLVFSPDPRFRAGECVIVCLSFIYYEYAEPDSAVVNYSKDLTRKNHGDFNDLRYI